MERQVDSLKLKAEIAESCSQENITLTVENQRLTNALKANKDSSAKVLELEHDLQEKVGAVFAQFSC